MKVLDLYKVTFNFLHNFLISCYPDAGGDRHGHLPGQTGPHVDVEILQQGPEEANEEHDHVEEAESNKTSCDRDERLLQKGSPSMFKITFFVCLDIIQYLT